MDTHSKYKRKDWDNKVERGRKMTHKNLKYATISCIMPLGMQKDQDRHKLQVYLESLVHNLMDFFDEIDTILSFFGYPTTHLTSEIMSCTLKE